MLDRTIRHQKPMCIIKARSAASRPVGHSCYDFFVFRMVARSDFFERYMRAWLKFINAIELVGPNELSCGKIPGKGPGQTECLALRKKRFATPQILLNPFAVVDVGEQV